MTIVRSHFGGRRSVGPENMVDSILRGRYLFETFTQEPLVSKKGAVYVAPAGTSLQEQFLDTGRYRIEYTFLGDATDAFVPTLGTDGGYNWAALATATVDRGAEICFGGTTVAHPRNFIASSEDWFFRVLLSIDDASGVDIVVGFKKVATPVLTLTEVTDIAGLRIFGDSSSGLAALSIVTNLNNGGTSDVVSTVIDTGSLTDGQVIELEVQSIGKKAQFFVNGVRRFPSSPYTFDTSDVLAPVIRFLQTTDIAAEVKTFAVECGPYADRAKDSLLSLAFATT